MQFTFQLARYAASNLKGLPSEGRRIKEFGTQQMREENC